MSIFFNLRASNTATERDRERKNLYIHAFVSVSNKQGKKETSNKALNGRQTGRQTPLCFRT